MRCGQTQRDENCRYRPTHDAKCGQNGVFLPVSVESTVSADDELKDPYCDPDHPVVITFQDVSAASFKIQGGVEKTPCNVSTI